MSTTTREITRCDGVGLEGKSASDDLQHPTSQRSILDFAVTECALSYKRARTNEAHLRKLGTSIGFMGSHNTSEKMADAAQKRDNFQQCPDSMFVSELVGNRKHEWNGRRMAC